MAPLDIVEQLSLANLYGWMAYAIYDDLLDGEGDPSLLPCANFFLRVLMEIYYSLDARIAGAQSLFCRTMNRIDGANAWEQRYCRIPCALASAPPDGQPLPRALPSFDEHQTLADRSIGHAMGPLAELLHIGYPAYSEEYKNVELFFRHYLIARQLHDDAHDWTDDLSRGRINSVSTLILGCFRKKYSDEDNGSMTIIKTLPELKKIFWEKIIDDVVRTITSHITVAREARERSRILTDTDFMESALRNLESGARRAIKERNEAVIFLNDYNANLSR
jgi:hypothetical protein